ncbi:thioesterase II family protein [Streptomyces sp. AP-93]|uniref:thioesterase II family protein n=1 Tax=Streptomyces sp. AP-93 TaxID=2929048 RepID=UPI001FAEE06C|nr:alpha/beta fold hydrolase [Streptomyces sp. AP-93]MCJ0874451.1 alpha/beta fold hydrolase [Streptomyces sp. AP-93]
MTGAAVANGPWFRRYAPRPDAPCRVICFGPAGGSPAFFLEWARSGPPELEVLACVLPGREARAAEPPATDLSVLADEVAAAVRPLMDRRTVLFGHSMGAVLAWETTRRLEAAGGPSPAGLVVSGCSSPEPAGAPAARGDGEPDDQELAAWLVELGGTPEELLADPEARAVILAAFRSDLALLASHRPQPAPRVRTPLRVLVGEDDPTVLAADAERWSGATERFAGVRAFPGGHFYLIGRSLGVIAEVLAMTEPSDPPDRSRSPRTSPAFHHEQTRGR